MGMLREVRDSATSPRREANCKSQMDRPSEFPRNPRVRREPYRFLHSTKKPTVESEWLRRPFRRPTFL